LPLPATAQSCLSKTTDKVSRILQTLNAATVPEDMNLPGYRFHGLQGKPKRYSVDVNRNYRVTFGWEDGGAIDVDVEDTH
jgi:proteic killer suppression protein